MTTPSSTWELCWEAAPRPPVHPEPMVGRKTFKSMEAAIGFFASQSEDAKLISLVRVETLRIDQTYIARQALATRAEHPLVKMVQLDEEFGLYDEGPEHD